MKKERPQQNPEKINERDKNIWKKKPQKVFLNFLFFASLLLLSFSNTQAQVVLATEDFDGGGIGFTTTSDFNNGSGNNHFSDTDGTDISNVSGAYSFEGGGNIFWAAENTDDPAGNGADEQRLATNDFSIDGYEDIMVCIDMAAGNEQLGNLGTYDQADYVSVQFNTDIEPLYRDALNFKWSSNPFDASDLFNQPLHHDVNRDGDGSDGPQITTTAQNFCYTISNAFTSDVDATMMSIRVLVHMEANSEEIAFDNIVVSGALLPDVTPPAVTCAEFTGSGSSCPAQHDPNTPSGNWISVPASGLIGSAVGGGVVNGTIDLNACVTDDVSALSEMETMVIASYQENVTPCSKDIINEYQIRDAAGNISPTTFIFRGTITYSGPPPVITCPANITVDCGSSTDPAITGEPTATGCSPTLAFIDSTPSGPCGDVIRTWTATDGCGQTDSGGASVCTQTISFNDVQAPTSSCADPIEIFADFCPVGIGPGTPNGGWGNIPASGIIQLQVGPIHLVDLNCLMDNVSDIGNLQIRLASAQFIGTPTTCLRVLESVYDIRDAAGNIAPNLVTVHFTLENDDPITQTPSAGITCGETFTMQSELGYIYTVEPPSNGVSSNQDCLSQLIWATPIFESPCGDFTDFSISFSAESSPAPNDLPDNMIFGGTSGNPVPDFGPSFGYIPPSQNFYGSSEACSATTRVTYNLTDECGKTFTCFFLIEVTDNQDPVPTCNDIEVDLAAGTYTLTQGDEDAIGAGSSDNCGLNDALTGILPTTYTTADIGDNLVTYNVTDNCGNTSACVATVTVNCPLTVDCSLVPDQDLECVSDLPAEDLSLLIVTDSCVLDLTRSANTLFSTGTGCPGNPLIIDRTYSVTDGFTNGGCTQIFTVESTMPPTIECPADATVQCDEDSSPASTGMATGMASCSNFTVDITFNDVTTQTMMGCGQYQYTIERTWTATDNCNRVVTCLQTIEVIDDTPPVITCPANVVIECDEDNSPANTGMATGTDNCSIGAEVAITFSDLSTQGMGCSEFSYMITRTWTATDACDNSSTCSQTITVEDTKVPVITCPAEVTIECDEDSSPTNTGMATAIDNCTADADVAITFDDVSTQGMGCSEFSYIIIRTWIATDACDNSSTCSQTITVEDTTLPVITCAADVTIECDEDSSPANTGMATATDNCTADADVVITFDDVSTQGMACGEFSYIIIRTWTATDACDNSSTCSQIVTVEDNNAPTITCPADVTVECDQPTDPGATGNATATGDNCAADDQLTVTFIDVSDQTPTGCGNDTYTITRTWTASDPCGNTDQCVQIISVEDTNPPTIVCPANTTLECDEDTSPANTGTAVGIDDCASAAEIVITFADVSTQTATGCGQYQYVITRTWTATDPCGNAANCIQVITVEDTTAPEIICPANVFISCTDSTDPADNGIATGSDNCADDAEVVITFSDLSTQTNQGCGQFTYTITRTWRATDPCGNASSCVQIVNVADTEAPVITCPPNQVLTCFESIPPVITSAADFVAAGGTIADNCTSSLSDFTVFATNDDNGGTNCPGDARVLVRTLFVQDACGNTSTCEQTFTYQASTQGPVITSILPTCYKYCASLVNPMEADITYDTDCSFGATVNVTGPTQIGQDNCPGSIYRYTYTVTDDCGRTSAPVTRDFIIGNDGPTIECAPFNLILECGDINNQDFIDTHLSLFEVNTACELGYTVNHFPQNFNLTVCGSSTVVTFVATDDCGRTASCTTTVAIQDNTPPTFTAVPPSVCDAIDCSADINYWYNHWIDYMEDGLEAEDACDTNVSIQAVNTPVNTDCPNGNAITVVTFVATDNCGNESEITGTFTVTATPDNMTVMGMVATEQGETVGNVTVTLEGPNNYTEVDETAEDGLYGFENLLLGNNYEVTPFLDQDPLNGVSSFDLVLMSKHILQIQLLDSPYKMIAADVNNSGSISTMDIVALRKMILHIDEAFGNNTSWRFVEGAYMFPEPNNPFATIFPEEVLINGLTAGAQHDFVGVKIGDVNGSVAANAQADAEDRTFDGQLNFGLENRELEAGKTYEVNFLADDFVEMMGYQFTLNFDATQIEFAGIEAGSLPNMTESNFGLTKLAEGMITTSWTNQKAVTMMDDATLFTLRFTAKANSTLSDVISVGSRYTAAEAYRKIDTNSGIALEELALRFNTDDFDGAKFELHQNAPNPFADETLIGFNLPSNSNATITIYDISGRMLKQVKGEYAKGYHTVVISKDELKGSTGILYYELATPTQRVTKKMTLIRR